MTRRPWPVALWAAALTVLGVADLLLDRRHDGSTLSEVTRTVFRVDTAVGRAAFTLTLSGGALSFARHIMKKEGRAWRP